MRVKICCFGDLHYSGSRDWLVDFIGNNIASICNEGGVDAVAVVGDITGYGDLGRLREVLEILKESLNTKHI